MDTSKELKSNRPLNVISFCSGYGGIERGLDLAGTNHRVLAYVEIEAYAIANLVNKMESGQLDPAPIYTDLKTFPAHLFRDCVDLLTGGYPCQPFSAAGKRKGEEDPRHLWPYIRRHIDSIRPTQCFFENVEGHISLGLSSVISDMEEDGYSTTWGIFSAAEVGAPHQRKRVYILANTISHPIREQPRWVGRKDGQSETLTGVDGEAQRMADTISPRTETRLSGSKRPHKEGESGEPVDCCGQQSRGKRAMHWAIERNVGRVVDGATDRVDRIRLLGNGVVPQTAAKAWEALNAR